MLTVKFYYRDSSRKDDHPGRLVIRLIHQRKIASITTSIPIFRKEWDEKKQQTFWDGKDPKRRNYLKEVSRQIRKEQEQLFLIADRLEEEGRLQVNTLSRLYRQARTSHTWMSLAESLSSELYQLGQFRTAEAYRSTVRRLLRFTGQPGLTLEEVDSLLIRQFEKQLLEEKKSLNTISFYMRNLRAMLSKAVKKGWLETPGENLFTDVFTGVGVTRKRALPKEELSRLNHLFHDPSSSLTKSDRDALGLFLFSFHARGMSFVDMAHLKKEDIRDEKISYIRRKTGKLLEVEINSELKKILRYFTNSTDSSSYLLPVIKNTSTKTMKDYYGALRLQNRRLKRFNISPGKSISTHMARHSWATIAKGENISTRVISECLGHSSEKTTQIYLDSFNRSVLEDASRKIIRALKKAAG